MSVRADRRSWRESYREERLNETVYGGKHMWLADKYIDHVKEQTAAHPGESWDQMLLGFKLNKLRTKLLPKKGISKDTRSWRQ